MPPGSMIAQQHRHCAATLADHCASMYADTLLLFVLFQLLQTCRALNWEPDEQGINGMVITKTLPSEAAKVLDKGVRKMTPSIMTWAQYAEAAVNYVQEAAAFISNGRLCSAPRPYQPDYTQCAEHFLLHAGGYAILRGIQKGLRWVWF